MYAFFTVRMALVRPHFFPLSSAFLLRRVQSWFRIGKYDTKPTSTIYACINGVPLIRSFFKVIEVDFISIFVDRIGPRLERSFAISRKYRYETKLPAQKPRFLSVGEALRKSHFLSPSWTSLSFPSFPSLLPSLILKSILCSQHCQHSEPYQKTILFQPLSVLVATPFGSCCSPFRFLLQPLSVLVATFFASCCSPFRFLLQPLSVLAANPFGSCGSPFRCTARTTGNWPSWAKKSRTYEGVRM